MTNRRRSFLVGPSDARPGAGPDHAREAADRESFLERTPFGMPWRAPTWLILIWTALILTLCFAAWTDPANDGSALTFGWLLLGGLWCVGMVPLGLLWIAAWLRRRRDGADS